MHVCYLVRPNILSIMNTEYVLTVHYPAWCALKLNVSNAKVLIFYICKNVLLPAQALITLIFCLIKRKNVKFAQDNVRHVSMQTFVSFAQ